MKCRLRVTYTEEWQVDILREGLTPQQLAEMVSWHKVSKRPERRRNEYMLRDARVNKVGRVRVTEEVIKADIIPD